MNNKARRGMVVGATLLMTTGAVVATASGSLLIVSATCLYVAPLCWLMGRFLTGPETIHAARSRWGKTLGGLLKAAGLTAAGAASVGLLASIGVPIPIAIGLAAAAPVVIGYYQPVDRWLSRKARQIGHAVARWGVCFGNRMARKGLSRVASRRRELS